MATIKPRINISVPQEVKKSLEQLAKRDQMPTATKAEQLLTLALELEEDVALDALASKRDTDDAVFVPHDQVFGA